MPAKEVVPEFGFREAPAAVAAAALAAIRDGGAKPAARGRGRGRPRPEPAVAEAMAPGTEEPPDATPVAEGAGESATGEARRRRRRRGGRGRGRGRGGRGRRPRRAVETEARSQLGRAGVRRSADRRTPAVLPERPTRRPWRTRPMQAQTNPSESAPAPRRPRIACRNGGRRRQPGASAMAPGEPRSVRASRSTPERRPPRRGAKPRRRSRRPAAPGERPKPRTRSREGRAYQAAPTRRGSGSASVRGERRPPSPPEHTEAGPRAGLLRCDPSSR
jgi:ribonuclease E